MTDWESAVFVDAGAVADRVGDLDPRVGVGAGVRWRSPVGPLQADLAYGVQSKQLRLHLRLGFSF
jgi:translocation and assembly module TamA